MNRKYDGVKCARCDEPAKTKGLCKAHYQHDYTKTHKPALQTQREYQSKYRKTLKGRYKSLREGAAKREVPVELTVEEYSKIVKPNTCFYCSRGLPEFGHGLDRKDNTIGYTTGNVVPCCRSCNHIKSDTLSFDEMVMIMTRRKALDLLEKSPSARERWWSADISHGAAHV
jgi:hypothetical protein